MKNILMLENAQKPSNQTAIRSSKRQKRKKLTLNMDDDEAIHLSNKIFIKSMMFAWDGVVRTQGKERESSEPTRRNVYTFAGVRNEMRRLVNSLVAASLS